MKTPLLQCMSLLALVCATSCASPRYNLMVRQFGEEKFQKAPILLVIQSEEEGKKGVDVLSDEVFMRIWKPKRTSALVVLQSPFNREVDQEKWKKTVQGEPEVDFKFYMTHRESQSVSELDWEFIDQFSITSTPAYFIIGKDATIVSRYDGPDSSDARFRGSFTRWLRSETE